MVKINMEVMEMMLFFWQSTSEKEKVSDSYLVEIGEREEMTPLYNEEFTPESVRKVLSAITNREILSEKTKAEGRFWNNNMWILEDLSLATDYMLPPIKQLSGSAFGDKDAEIIFLPGTFDTVYRREGKLYVNFFKLMANPYAGDGEVTIEDKPFIEFIKEALEAV